VRIEALAQIRDIVQKDVGQRGLARDPDANLFNACPDDFAAACQDVASRRSASVAVATGFFIPDATPPAGETDGPLGALFLARALVPLGIRVAVLTDDFCRAAMTAGLRACGLENTVPLLMVPSDEDSDDYWRHFGFHLTRGTVCATHLIALERPGPSHKIESIAAQSAGDTSREALDCFERVVNPQHRNRFHNMAGRDITSTVSPVHRHFESARQWKNITTIGIGDGGNEIGMGKIPWTTIRRNIPNGGLIACRVPTDFLIVCGVSNWGAYGLAAGVMLLLGAKPDPALFSLETEKRLLDIMVAEGPLVDGVTKQQSASVDGLPFERYAAPLERIAALF
jgi:hypothetical protein